MRIEWEELLDEWVKEATTDLGYWEDFKDSLQYPYKLDTEVLEQFAKFCVKKLSLEKQEKTQVKK